MFTNTTHIGHTLLGMSLVAILLAGCSNPKEASKGNFETAINAAIQKEKTRGCLRLPYELPFKTSWATPDDANKQYAALAHAGLLQVKSNKPDPWSKHSETYDLTDKGREAMGSDLKSNALCYAVPEVTEIKNYQEPSSDSRAPIQVNFTYHLKSLSKEWSNNGDMIKAFPELKTSPTDNFEGSSNLQLYNDGWKPGRIFLQENPIK